MNATKNTGKPYAGKLHVRFDEGEKRQAIFAPLFSTLLVFLFIPSQNQFFMPEGFIRIFPQSLFLILFVFGIAAFKVVNISFTFKSKYVGADTV